MSTPSSANSLAADGRGLYTRRLHLRSVTPARLIAEQTGGAAALAAALDVVVPPDWPPEYHDANALTYTLDKLASGPEQAGWWTCDFVRRATPAAPAMLVGVGGFKGPPANGEVEIGYTLVPSQQGHGYATEAATALALHALAQPGVRRVIAETLPPMLASIRVLQRAGFVLAPDEGSEPGVIRFVLTPATLAPNLRP